MADLISLDDWVAAGGDVDDTSVSLAMSAASEMVRGFLHQQVDLVEDDVVTVVGAGTRSLLLPELPVVAINSVTVGDDPALDASEYREVYGVLWRVADGSCAVWPYGVDVVIDYSHGWSTVPADIRLVTARLAVAIAADTAVEPGLRQEAIQDYSYSRADASASMAAELAVIAHRVARQVVMP